MFTKCDVNDDNKSKHMHAKCELNHVKKSFKFFFLAVTSSNADLEWVILSMKTFEWTFYEDN